MRRSPHRLLVLLTLLLLGCGGSSSPPPADGGPPLDGGVAGKALSVATWNVQNFFDWIDDPGDDTVLSASDYTAKRQAVGVVLRTIDADVLVLQEIENERTATDLKSQELSSLNYGTPVVSQGNDNRQINIAVFSRYPVVSVISHKNDTFQSPNTGQYYTFARDCLEVEIDVEGARWVVYGIHFISQLGDSDDRRFAESAHVRSLVDRRLAADPDARVVVAGDVNDFPGSSPVTRLLGLGDTALIDPTLTIIDGLRYTYVFNGTPRQFDFIFASSGTAASSATAEIFHIQAVRDASDHRAVLVRFPGSS